MKDLTQDAGSDDFLKKKEFVIKELLMMNEELAPFSLREFDKGPGLGGIRGHWFFQNAIEPAFQHHSGIVAMLTRRSRDHDQLAKTGSHEVFERGKRLRAKRGSYRLAAGFQRITDGGYLKAGVRSQGFQVDIHAGPSKADHSNTNRINTV